ncbi:MAG: hypothetical protein H6721_27900 [Sandaracinus sp.]|nr:hypothetical protein [Sandaracinus sp.]MCB9635951.1 hypothetical protein [Sandaracinus sp.]
MNASSSRERVFAYVFSAAAILTVLSPVLRHPDEDSFPLSTYPMFSHERPREMTMTHVVGLDAEGTREPLPPRVSADTREVLQSMRTIEMAVHSGRAIDFCREVGERVKSRADLEHVREVVVETITFDSVAYFDEPAPEPERFVHARCEVLR